MQRGKARGCRYYALCLDERRGRPRSYKGAATRWLKKGLANAIQDAGNALNVFVPEAPHLGGGDGLLEHADGRGPANDGVHRRGAEETRGAPFLVEASAYCNIWAGLFLGAPGRADPTEAELDARSGNATTSTTTKKTARRSSPRSRRPIRPGRKPRTERRAGGCCCGRDSLENYES